MPGVVLLHRLCIPNIPGWDCLLDPGKNSIEAIRDTFFYCLWPERGRKERALELRLLLGGPGLAGVPGL